MIFTDDEIRQEIEARPEIVELISEAQQLLNQPDGAARIQLAVKFLIMTGGMKK